MNEPDAGTGEGDVAISVCRGRQTGGRQPKFNAAAKNRQTHINRICYPRCLQRHTCYVATCANHLRPFRMIQTRIQTRNVNHCSMYCTYKRDSRKGVIFTGILGTVLRGAHGSFRHMYVDAVSMGSCRGFSTLCVSTPTVHLAHCDGITCMCPSGGFGSLSIIALPTRRYSAAPSSRIAGNTCITHLARTVYSALPPIPCLSASSICFSERQCLRRCNDEEALPRVCCNELLRLHASSARRLCQENSPSNCSA